MKLKTDNEKNAPRQGQTSGADEKNARSERNINKYV